jgi:nucleoside-diphosphate-sugar epimerase
LRIGAIGASGVLGRSVLPLLLARGHDVHALVRSPQTARLAPHRRLTLFQADILERESLQAGVAECDAVLHLATAIPPPGTAPDWTRNTAVRTIGTRNLLQAATAAHVRRYIQQSIAMIYAGAGSEWITEASPTAPPSAISAPVLDMESQVRASSPDWIILRGGMFYGPGTARMFEWNELARAGRLMLPGQGDDYLSLIYVEDMASAVVAAAEAPVGRFTANIVDDEPVTYKDLFCFIADLHHAPRPLCGALSAFPSLRVTNALAKERLDWKPQHTYRTGWIAGPAPAERSRPEQSPSQERNE